MEYEVAIVGAGPYGLSIGAHLKDSSIDFAAFGRPLETWRRHMPAGMLLKSDGFASNLAAPIGGWALSDYCGANSLAYGDREPRVPLATFIDYALAFQQRFVPELDTRAVAHLEPVARGFTLTLDDGASVAVRRVVLAVGITHFANMPRQLDDLGERATHSSSHRHFEEFAGKRVAVLGAGSSAVEVAAGLIDAGAEVHVVTRRADLPFWDVPSGRIPTFRDRIRTPSSGIGPGWRSKLCQDLPDVFRLMPADYRLRVALNYLGPVSGWWLKEKVLTGAHVITRSELRHVAVEQGDAVLRLGGPDGTASQVRVDHVIAATGYLPDLDRVPFLDDALRSTVRRVGTMPELSRNFESSVRGLYFVGSAAAATFGPLMRFMVGAEFAAPRVAEHLARRHRRDHYRPRARGENRELNTQRAGGD